MQGKIDKIYLGMVVFEVLDSSIRKKSKMAIINYYKGDKNEHEYTYVKKFLNEENVLVKLKEMFSNAGFIIQVYSLEGLVKTTDIDGYDYLSIGMIWFSIQKKKT